MNEFGKIKPQSRAEMVVDRITNSIINGDLTDGEMLPPEKELCLDLGVSRSVLREAVRVLAAKGLILVKQGHGTFVKQPKIDIPEEAVRNYLMTRSFSLHQLMEVRRPIELEIARLAALRRDESHLAAMEKSLEVMADDLASDEAYAEADADFHRSLIEASGNPIFGIMIRSIMVNLHISRQLAIRHFGIEVVSSEHTAVLEAIRSGDSEAARQKMKTHMDRAVERIDKTNALLNK